MTLVFPRTDVMGFCGYTPEAKPLRLLSRQELSFEASGISHGKDYGPGLWLGEFVTEPLSHTRASEFEAILDSLDGVVASFEACDLRKPYPAAYPTGDFDDTGTIRAVVGARLLSLENLPAAFTLTRGDYLAFDYGDPERRALHRVMETVVANGSGVTAGFEVRPDIRDATNYEVGTEVTLKNPMGLFRLVPEGVASTMVTSKLTKIAFKAVQDA